MSFNPLHLPSNFTNPSTPQECFWSEPYSQEIWMWLKLALGGSLSQDPVRPSPVCVRDIWKERWVQCIGILNICSLYYLLLSWILLKQFQWKDFIAPSFYIWGLTCFYTIPLWPSHNFFFEVTLNLRMLILWFQGSKMCLVLQSENQRNHQQGRWPPSWTVESRSVPSFTDSITRFLQDHLDVTRRSDTGSQLYSQ